MNCGPAEDYCTGDKVIPCACVCDNCEIHDMECTGCLNCDLPKEEHVWTKGLDPRYWICIIAECGMVRLGEAA